MDQKYKDLISIGDFAADAFRAIIDKIQDLYHAIQFALKQLGLKDE